MENSNTSIDGYDQNRHLSLPAIPAAPPRELLKGQVALVTGANSGIGRAIALALGRAGADIVINYVTASDKAESVAAEIRGGGRRAITAEADVSNEAEVHSMFATATRELGPVDILVNHAGLEKNAPFHEMTVDQWDEVMNVNLRGAFLCSREAVRGFLKCGVRRGISVSAGKIIFVSPTADIIPWTGHVNYAASKGGLSLLMKSLAQEVAGQRIRVNSISPGATRRRAYTGPWQPPEVYADLIKLVPYQLIGEPDEIGRAAVWLASDFTDHLVGSTIYMDGGMTLYPNFKMGG